MTTPQFLAACFMGALGALATFLLILVIAARWADREMEERQAREAVLKAERETDPEAIYSLPAREPGHVRR
jgi:hypothetical protein